MNDLFIKKYNKILDKRMFFKQLKIYSLQRFLLRFLANFFVPIWFVLTRKLIKVERKVMKNEKKVIVSLTTFPGRINRIWIVIECLLRQSFTPDLIILWLSKEQFNGIESLPKNLLRLQKRGLEIVFCEEDLRSHKKYYYSLKKYPDDILITVDDDFIYSSFLIEDLMKLHSKHPNEICCLRALEIVSKDNKLSPYNKWEIYTKDSQPTFNLFFTSGGGTLFPPNSLHNDVLIKDLFMNLCKYADDVWLNFMSQMNQTKIVKSKCDYELSIPLYFKENSTLSSINVDDGLNDKQIIELRNYYLKNKNIDPLINYINYIN